MPGEGPVEVASASGSIVRIGALRSRLVSKLTGLTRRQLQHWHGTVLLPAHERPGARGHPRLYSWVDYMKLREAAKLSAQGVSTRVIRDTVPVLEDIDPEWYLLPLQSYAPRHRRIAARLKDGLAMLADRSGQLVLSWETLEHTLTEIEEEGPLGELHEFRDAVAMDPSVLAGNPVVLESRLETDFLASLSAIGYVAPDIADLYRLPLNRVERALAFEQQIAA
jgi:DNA-binding transcriptional MerR regulator